MAIGHQPNTEIFKGILDMDEIGYLKVIPGSTKTAIEGVFAAGDVADKTTGKRLPLPVQDVWLLSMLKDGWKTRKGSISN